MGVYIGGGGLRKGINYEKVEWLKNNSVANYMQFSVPSCYLDDIRISAKFDISDQITFRNESHFNFCSTSIGRWNNNFIVIHKENNGLYYLCSGLTHITPISGTVEFTMNGRTVRVNGNDTIREAYTDEINQLVILGSYYYGATGIKTAYFNFYSPGKNIELIPVRLLSDITRDLAIDNKAHSAGECGMIDKISNIFYANAGWSSSGYIASGEVMDKIIVDKKVKYFAIKNSTNVVYPKKIYWANSTNSVQLIYKRPTYDIHIINLAINTKLGNADKVSEIKFTNNLNLRNLAYNDNVVDVTYSSNIPTYEFLVQNQDNDTFTCYIANAFWGENSKVYCYGDFGRCFMNCSMLTTIPVSNFDTSKVTNMQFMFTNLQSIKRLDISNFNISSVTSLSSFIRNCYELEYLKLPVLNTLNAINCSYMFNYNPKLISLNLNSFSTDNCKDIVLLFSDNYSLRRIFANTLDTSSLENHTLDNGVVVPGDYNVFIYNRALKGGNGTTYDANHIDSEYARIDGENGLPGYFTDPADAIKITLINVDNEGYTDEIYLCAGDTYTIPVLDGYTGVITDNNSNTYSDGDTITINQNITLTFVWSAD